MRHRGVFVAVLGVDGAGKSTVISGLAPLLNAAGWAYEVKHLRPGLLPPLGRLKGAKTHVRTTAQAPQNPHSSDPSGTIGSMARLLYLMVDYVAGYWFLTRRRTIGEGALAIFDRYAYDLTLDPRRFRIRLPRAIIRSIVSLAPTPDLVICLEGDPEVISARKNELPSEEVRRQIEGMRELARNCGRALLISTTQRSVEETIELVFDAIRAHAKSSCANTQHGD